VKDVADLYSLRKDDLLSLEGFAEKKADNLIAAIDASRSQNLSRLLNALGIRGVGEVGAFDLARQFGDLDRLTSATLDELLQIEGVGPNIAQAVVDWFNSPSNQELLQRLKSAGVWPVEKETTDRSTADLKLYGQTFVITGTLPNMSRQEAKETIERYGGKVTNSVSSKTSYLLMGDNPGSKFNKAQELDVPILDEAGLRQLIAS
jgi:DNA ligase (NAD+)